MKKLNVINYKQRKEKRKKEIVKFILKHIKTTEEKAEIAAGILVLGEIEEKIKKYDFGLSYINKIKL